MSKLRCHISISLDGFVAGPNQSEENPLGEGGERLHDWVVPLAAWRRSHGKQGGEVNQSTRVFEESVENVGSAVMGRNMFGPIGGGADRTRPPQANGPERVSASWGQQPAVAARRAAALAGSTVASSYSMPSNARAACAGRERANEKSVAPTRRHYCCAREPGQGRPRATVTISNGRYGMTISSPSTWAGAWRSSSRLVNHASANGRPTRRRATPRAPCAS